MSIEQNNTLRDANYSEDEISLYDLYKVLVKRKLVISSVLVLSFVLCVIYILVAPKIYQETAVLLPPTSGDIYLTNMDIANVTDFKPDQIFKLYHQELSSNERWYDFTKKNKNLFPNPKDESLTKNPFVLDKDKNIPNDHVLLKYDTPDKDTAVAIVQHYLHFAEQGLIDVLTQQITQYINHSTKALELEIQFERETARQARMDKIVQLENDLAIAKKLGIVDNLYFNLAGKLTGNKSGVFNIFTNNTSTPTYLRGTKVITAELESLKQRESDDPYIPSLRQKQDQLLKLSKIQFTPGAFHPYRLDGEITQPMNPVKPKKKLVLVLGLVLGLFLGIFAAFVAEFISKAREQELSES